MDKLRNTGLACVAWLCVAAFAANTADGQTAQGTDINRVTPASPGTQAPAGGSYASEVPPSENSIGTDLTGNSSDDSIPVAAETAFVLRNKYRKQGGYDENLKHVARIEYYGTRYVDCEHYPVEIRVTRPDEVRMLVKAGASSDFAARKSGRKIVIRGQTQGIPSEDERALLETFDFDTPIVDLQKKHSTLRPVGMQKIPHILAWKFEGGHAGEYYRVLYVDAHSGDVVRYAVMKVGGVPLLDVALHDYRIVKG
ncbi:MAG TPA: hypothetical protein VGT07_07540, partial [Steroidobacteraceae bacterium]|nr:hypothetical protein [Steroidobacteraceae bacterium]